MSFAGIERRQELEGVVERHEIFASFESRELGVQRQDLRSAAALLKSAGPRELDEDLAHRSGGYREKVRSIFPLDVADVDEAQIRLMNKGRGLQRVARPLVAHLTAGQPPQLVVDDGDELLERSLIAAAPREQEPGDRVIGGGRAQLIGQRETARAC